MNRKFLHSILVGTIFVLACSNMFGQAIERPRPPEWDQLVYGARFIDRFLPMPPGTLKPSTLTLNATPIK